MVKAHQAFWRSPKPTSVTVWITWSLHSHLLSSRNHPGAPQCHQEPKGFLSCSAILYMGWGLLSLSPDGGWPINFTSPTTHLRQEGRSGTLSSHLNLFLSGSPLKQPEPPPTSFIGQDRITCPSRPTTSKGEWPSWITPKAEDKPHIPQVHYHLMPEQTQGCVSKDQGVMASGSVQLMVLLDTQQMTSFEVLKHPSGCSKKTGMDRPRVSWGPARRLSH